MAEPRDLRKERPLLNTLSIRDYKVDERVINQALWGSNEPPKNVQVVPNEQPRKE